VARAKRTDRAEARRKYRAYLLAQEEAGVADETGAAATPGAAPAKTFRGRDPRSVTPLAPTVRLGIVAAARAAYRTPHYIDDIRTAPALIFRSNAIWPVAAICVAAGAYFSVRLSSGNYGNDPVLPALYQFLFFPVPLLPPMIAGFFAPRSTWLAGIIASFIATMTLVVVVGLAAGKFTNSAGGLSVGSPEPSSTVVATANGSVSETPLATASPAPSASPSPSGATSSSSGTTTGTTFGDLLNLAVILLAQSLAFGALMAALSGWYKRFLALTSGPRRPPASKSGGSRPQRRRPVTSKS